MSGLADGGFDATNAGGDSFFFLDDELAEVAGVARVGAATEFHGVTVEGERLAADLYDADEVAVFVAEELHDVFTAFDIGVRDFLPRDGLSCGDAGVDLFFDGRDLLRSEGGGGEVEAQTVRRDEGALLGGVGGDYFVEGPVKKVGCGVVGLDGTTTVVEDAEGDFVAHLKLGLRGDEMGASGTDLLGAADEVFGIAAFVKQFAFVPLLATHFGVESGLIGDDEELVLGGVEFENGGFTFVVVEADEVGDGLRFEVEGGDGFRFLSSAGTVALLFHKGFDRLFVEGESTFTTEESSEVERKAEGVVEFEGFGRGEFLRVFCKELIKEI